MRTSALDRPDAPLASAPFSQSVTRRTPRAASAYAVLMPLTPPPITTTSAVSAIGARLLIERAREPAGHPRHGPRIRQFEDGVPQSAGGRLAENWRRQLPELRG